MKIFIGADHRGFGVKEAVIQILKQDGHTVIDVGTDTREVSCDYPVFSYKVAKAVAGSRDSRGILICMSGIGHAIAANKVRGVYAALCYNKKAARFSREHNNSNVLVLGAMFVNKKDIKSIIRIWLKTPFSGGRHLRRLNQIKRIEAGRVPQ
ncbi:MAG: ribose 5-phosphate isomerase B [Candidatus Omnitrophota bacterium]